MMIIGSQLVLACVAMKPGHWLDTFSLGALTFAWPFSDSWAAILAITACLIAFLGYLRSTNLSLPRRFILGMLRTASLWVLLLISGSLSWSRSEIEPADLVFLVDNSISMQSPDEHSVDSTSRWQRLREVLGSDPKRVERLSQRFRLHWRSVDGSFVGNDTLVSAATGLPIQDWTPTAKASPLGDVLRQTAFAQRGRNASAIILLSDGIVTEGQTLAQAAASVAQIGLPVLTVGFGSEVPPLDVAVENILTHVSTRLGETIDVNAVIQSCGGNKQPCNVLLVNLDNQEILDSKSIACSHLTEQQSVHLTFTPDNAQTFQLAVIAEAIPGEANLENNRRTLTIDVRDDPIRILLIQDQPSYEFRYLKHLLERFKTEKPSVNRRVNRSVIQLTQLTSLLQSGDPQYADQDRAAIATPPVELATLKKFDVVVLSDADTSFLGPRFLERLATAVQQHGVGLVIVVGPLHFPKELIATPLASLLPIAPEDVEIPRFPVTTPIQISVTDLGRSALAFDGSEFQSQSFPTLYGLWKTSTPKPGARILMEGKEPGASQKAWPLVITHLVGMGQVWIQLSDELHRLQTFDGSGKQYLRYWTRCIGELAQGKQRAQNPDSLDVLGQAFPLGANVPIRVQIAGDLPQATVHVRGDAWESTAVLPKTAQGLYQGVAAGMPIGTYRVTLIDSSSESVPSTDTFMVHAAPQDGLRRLSDLSALGQLAETTGGTYMNAETAIQNLENNIPQKPTGQKTRRSFQPLWNHPLMALLLFGLLCSEWILRRRWRLV